MKSLLAMLAMVGLAVSPRRCLRRFRLYGPEKAVFDKSFRLPDIERIN